VLTEFADQAARRAADYDRAQQGRREQAHDQAHAAAPPHALPAQVVTGLGDLHLAVCAMLNQDHALGSDRLVLHPQHQGVEVLLRRPSRRVRRHDHVKHVSHPTSSPLPPPSYGS
jgi:hypothetical protein